VIQAVQSNLLGAFNCGVEFFRSYPPVDLRECFGLERRIILVRDIDIGVPGNFLSDKSHDLGTASQFIGQDKMAD
jgi:hypothetical protein